MTIELAIMAPPITSFIPLAREMQRIGEEKDCNETRRPADTQPAARYRLGGPATQGTSVSYEPPYGTVLPESHRWEGGGGKKRKRKRGEKECGGWSKQIPTHPAKGGRYG